jgi:CheY-like chemotaxis protein
MTQQTVLIVDDATLVRDVVVQILAPLGLSVIEAQNGRQALSLLRKQRVDVVVSDLIMPRMSGLMLLHAMLEQGLQIPFIVVTGHGDKDSAIQALRLGAFDYLEKPVDPTDLLSVVKEAIEVSREQLALSYKLHGVGNPRQVPVDKSTGQLILKMRALRSRDGEPAADVAPLSTTSWRDLLAVFLAEADPQLTFAESTLGNLTRSDNVGRDVAYFLRVIQSIRMASEALRLSDLSDYSWSLEAAAATFRRHPLMMTSEATALLVEGCRMLREKIAAMANSRARAVQDQLDAVSEARLAAGDTPAFSGRGGRESA